MQQHERPKQLGSLGGDRLSVKGVPFYAHLGDAQEGCGRAVREVAQFRLVGPELNPGHWRLNGHTGAV